jgi:hypothetical protein
VAEISVDTVEQAREELRKAGFRAEDLDENRVGRLAPAQSGYSWASITTVRILLLLLAILGFGAAALAVVAVVLNALPFFIALLLALLGIAFAGGLFFLERDLRAPLRQLDGDLAKRVEREGRLQTRHFYACVDPGDQCFEVPRRVFKLMPAGGPCRVYYTPGFKFLVNVELLPGWRPLD